MIYWQETVRLSTLSTRVLCLTRITQYTTCYAEPRATVALRSQYRRGNTPLGLFTREQRGKNRKEASSPRSNSPPPPPPPPPNSPVRTTTYYNAADDHPTERSVVLAKGRAIKKWVGAACHGVFRTHRYVNVWDRAPLEVRVTKTQVEAVKYIDQ